MTTNDADARTLDRRRFVKIAGASAGLAAAGPLVSAAKAQAASAIPLKVGVLAPTGSSYSRMGQSLLDGLTLGFDEARSGASPVNATLVQREVDRGFGGALSTSTALLDANTDAVVAGISALVADRIGSLFSERRVPLVVADVGAHLVPPASRNAYVLHNSLLYWQASYAAGLWAAANLGTRAFVASGLSDSGYDTVYAFRRGFESAGGTVVGEAVTHADTPGLAELFAAVRSSGANVVYGLYSGAHAVEFVQGYAGSGVGAKLAVGNLAVEDYLLSDVGTASVGATSCASWTGTRATKANQAFTKAFKSRFGRTADPFAALGYDTAVLVAEGARRASKSGLGVRRLIDALDGASIEGPRGTLVVDAATNTVTCPLSIRQVKRTVSGLANVDVAQAQVVGSFPSALGGLAAGPVSGYINEYLCA
jgi:branched-chain amino acid transport system substrate-binding protein